MRGRQISNEELREQILEDGEEFGIVPMDTTFRDVVAAEDILTILPLAPGLNCIEEVTRDICSVSQAYPLSAVIASRKKRAERTFAHRAEIAQMAQNRVHELRKQDAYHELAGDIRRADKIRVPILR